MIPAHARISFSLLIILFSVFLIGAGFSRYLETDSGNILIHDVDVESYEAFLYGGRLFRPLQASSLNQRPSVLLIPGVTGDRYTCDHIAMEFARRGFVVLTVEDFSQGMTGPEPDFDTENLIDAGYTYLATRSFTDHDRIGIICFYDGAARIPEAKDYPLFASRALVSPRISDADIVDGAVIYTARYESDSEFRVENDDTGGFSASHAGMLADHSVIAALLEQFHEDMPIPDDSPFWFDAGSQHAQLLVGIRAVLLILLVVICSGLSAVITSGKGVPVWRFIAGIILPLLVFQIVGECLNFFLISVRLGSAFHYLPRLAQIQKDFSLPAFIVFCVVSLLGGISFGRSDRPFFAADLLAAAGAVLCLAGFLPVLFGFRSGWDLAGAAGLRWSIGLITVFACAEGLLLRLTNRRGMALFCSAFVSGVMFYLICCGLPAAALY